MNKLQDTARFLTPAQENLLDLQLAHLRAAVGNVETPPRVEAALMVALQSPSRGARAKRRHWREFVLQWFAPGIALAATAGMSAWMVLAPMTRPVLDPALTPGTPVADFTSADFTSTDSPFIALQSLEQIAREPRPRVIETRVPLMWLASYGVAINPETAGESMRAEMLVSANGQPLAMRFRP